MTKLLHEYNKNIWWFSTHAAFENLISSYLTNIDQPNIIQRYEVSYTQYMIIYELISQKLLIQQVWIDNHEK